MNDITQAKQLRDALGLSQTKMSELMGMPVTTWRSWESGVRSPSGAGVRLMEFIALVNMMNPAIIQSMIAGIKS